MLMSVSDACHPIIFASYLIYLIHTCVCFLHIYTKVLPLFTQTSPYKMGQPIEVV